MDIPLFTPGKLEDHPLIRSAEEFSKLLEESDLPESEKGELVLRLMRAATGIVADSELAMLALEQVRCELRKQFGA